MIVITISVLFLFLIWLFSNGEKENTTISPGKPENASLRKLEGKGKGKGPNKRGNSKTKFA